MSRPEHDERGAIAIMFGLLSVMLLIIAAFAVDLGNAYAEKRERQKDTDLATLAGAGISGDNLPGPGTGGSCAYGDKASPGDQAVKDVALYLSKQLGTTISANSLTNCDVTGDGEVFYGKPTKTASGWSLAPNKNQLSLVSPPKDVDFGFAGVMGINEADVNGVSTVEIRSPKMGVLPFYAASGCDYGPQTLSQPNNGNAAADVLLANPLDAAPGVTVSAIVTTPATTPPKYVYENPPDPTAVKPLRIDGSFPAGGIQAIGFFEPGNAVAGPPPVQVTDATKWTQNGANTQIQLNDLPDLTNGVTTVQTYWYVRVKVGGEWSKVNYGNAANPVWTPMLTIGDPPLICGQGSSDGNFGTLKFQTSGQWQVTARNIALPLPKNLDFYPTASRTSDGLCTSVGNPPAIKWDGVNDMVNCVETETGMAAAAATAGFITGHSSFGNGRLDLAGTNTAGTGCADNGLPAQGSVLGKTINNDTLSCFLTNTTTTLSQVATANYTLPAPVFNERIYSSPRFGYVPALHTIPGTGGSQAYQIWDFRPVFVTDQPLSAIKTTPVSGIHAGITLTSNGNDVQSVQVIFLNQEALPNPPAAAGTTVYNGNGAKIPIMVN